MQIRFENDKELKIHLQYRDIGNKVAVDDTRKTGD